MKNPFLTVGYQGPEYFCNREKETLDLINALESGRHITLHSIRKLGKTGLIHHIFYQIRKKKKNWLPVYIDVYDSTNASQFVNSLITNVINSIDQDHSNILKRITTFFGQYRPSIGFDAITGTPTITLDIRTENEVKMSLDTLFHIISENKKTVIIAIDEFQVIGKYPEEYLPATIRKYLQSTQNIRMLFAGSQHTLFLEMFTSAKHALYRVTQLYSLNYLDRHDYKKFINSNFEKGGKTLDDSIIEEILDWTRLHTFYTQYFCNRLYELPVNFIGEMDLAQMKYNILKEHEVIFHSYRNLLTRPQWDLLRAIANEGEVDAPTSGSFINKYSLKAHSTVRLSLQYLEQNELIFRTYDKKSGKPVYHIYDVFLWRWLEKKPGSA